MKNKIIFILSVFFLMACSAQQMQKNKEKRANRKLLRLEKKNPFLVTSDTIMKDTIVTAPAIVDSVSFEAKSDTATVDSLTNHFAPNVDSTTLDSMNLGFKKILKKAENFDTIIKTSKAKYHIKDKNGVVSVDIVTDPAPVKFKYPAIINKGLPPKIELTRMEKIFIWIGKKTLVSVGSLLFILFLVLIIRVVKKEFTGS